jgi:hypothetical protein
MAGTAVAIAHVRPLEKGCKLHPSASLSMNREPGKNIHRTYTTGIFRVARRMEFGDPHSRILMRLSKICVIRPAKRKEGCRKDLITSSNWSTVPSRRDSARGTLDVIGLTRPER